MRDSDDLDYDGGNGNRMCSVYCYLTNHSKLSSIKYNHFYYVGQEFRQSPTEVACLLYNVTGLIL